jgi:hypothetical protein
MSACDSPKFSVGTHGSAPFCDFTKLSIQAVPLRPERPVLLPRTRERLVRPFWSLLVLLVRPSLLVAVKGLVAKLPLTKSERVTCPRFCDGGRSVFLRQVAEGIVDEHRGPRGRGLRHSPPVAITFPALSYVQAVGAVTRLLLGSGEHASAVWTHLHGRGSTPPRLRSRPTFWRDFETISACPCGRGASRRRRLCRR